MTPSNLSLLIAALLCVCAPAYAQDPTGAPAGGGADVVSAPPAEQPPATNPPATNPPAEQPPATNPPATNPPSEQPPAAGEVTPPSENAAIEMVVVHIEAMTKIIEANIDQPDKAIAEFEAYLKANAQAMRDANAAIEAKLKGLAPDESQSYQEGMQRRLEDPLRKFMSAMLNFGRKHPEKAKELDEKLQSAASGF